MPGTYSLLIYNNYDVKNFNGDKYFIISTTNGLGGENYFLSICYLAVGTLCLVFAIIFLIVFLKKRSARHND
jgi:hypothetical protein